MNVIQQGTGFSVKQRQVPCRHKFQLYVDYGVTQQGVWAKVGLNTTEYVLGYPPKPIPRLHMVKEG